MARLGYWLADKGFGHPSGPLGWLGGRLMARGNAATELHMVDLAKLTKSDVVLVVGPGPGVGLEAAAQQADRVVGIDPSGPMLRACYRRCTDAVEQGRVQLVQASAEHTELPERSVDVVITVNNVQIWPDRDRGCVELARVLRPGGRLLISTHQKWLPGGAPALVTSVSAAGLTDIRTWSWKPPRRGSFTATQLHALLPS